MKRIILPIFAVLPMLAGATYMQAPAMEDVKPVTPDSTGFSFTDIKINKTTPVKDQNKSGTCWAFSGTSVLEEDVLRRGGEELDLSEMYCVRQNYIDKAKKFMRTGGKINFAQGGGFADVAIALDLYGTMPEEAYKGLNYGEDKHSHYEMDEALEAYLNAINKNSSKRLSSAWLPGFIGILDAYLGTPPETFEYKGKTYTPKEFAKAVGLDGRKFKSFTSYTDAPFYTWYAIEIPDNWRWERSFNLPMEELKKLVDEALENGYTVGWAADVSEPTFRWKEGYAVLPVKKTEADMTGSELARWVKLSDADRKKKENEVHGPTEEIKVTQEERQRTYDNRETTDDHGMVIVGYAKDQEGNRYYKVKNSWDTNQIYDGYLYVSEPYFLAKTISVIVNEDAVPKNIKNRM